MFFPEALYLLSARDQQITWLEPVLLQQVNQNVDTFASTTFTVPIDRALLLQHGLVEGLAGAAQTVSSIELDVLPPQTSLNPMQLIFERNLSVPSLTESWQGSIVVPRSWRVQCTAFFNAGAASNQVSMSLAGLLIPNGNLARI